MVFSQNLAAIFYQVHNRTRGEKAFDLMSVRAPYGMSLASVVRHECCFHPQQQAAPAPHSEAARFQRAI
jgi:hypothetical protein